MRARTALLAASLCALAAATTAPDAHAQWRNKGVEALTQMVPMAAGLGQVANPPALEAGPDAQRRSYGMVPHPGLEAHLNEILQEIQRQWPGEPAPARVYATPAPTFQAFSHADGSIFLTTGALKSLESRDELAALVAHEYAHVVLEHHELTRLGQLSQQAYGLGRLYLDHRFAGQTVDMMDTTATATRQVLLNELTLESIQSGLVPKMTRGKESEADRLATDLLVRAGYNPVAMNTLLLRIGEWEKANAELAAQRDERIALLEQAWDAKGDANEHLQGLATSAVQGVSRWGARALSKLRRSHDPAEDRREDFRGYLDQVHPEAARPELRPLPWDGAQDIAALFAGIAATHELSTALRADDAGQVQELATQVRQSPAAGIPYARLMLASLPGRQLEDALGEEVLRPDSLFTAHVQLLDLLERRQPDRALQVWQHSRGILGDPNDLLPYGVRLHKRAGNQDDAAILLARCRAAGDRDLAQACE